MKAGDNWATQVQDLVDHYATLLINLLIKTTRFWVKSSEHRLRIDFADNRNLSTGLAAAGVLDSSTAGEPT